MPSTSFGVQDESESPKCFVISDLRGDYRLWLTCVQQIAQAAEFNKQSKKWEWKARNVTLIVLGNFTDRFGAYGYNRFLLTTREAIEQETKIIQAFDDLEAHASANPHWKNAMVVLMGDHEMGNLLGWSEYQVYQMQKPEDQMDQKLRETFIEEELRPLALRHGVVARWANLYCSHAGLELAWFKKFKPKSIQELNRSWQQWLSSNNQRRLKLFHRVDSPVLSDKMALQPHQWRQEDLPVLRQVLGVETIPKFVQSANLPVQRLASVSWDPFLRRPQCENKEDQKRGPTTVLASRDADGTDQIYFCHNAMADVFCLYDDYDRRPQVLEFSLKVNGKEEALYADCRTLQLSEEEYSFYLEERPRAQCQVPPEIEEDIEVETLAEDEKLALDKWRQGSSSYLDIPDATPDITKVALVLFSPKWDKIFLVKKGFLEGPRDEGEDPWRALRKLTQVELKDGGQVMEVNRNTRLWVKQTSKELPSTDVSSQGQWVTYKHVHVNDLSRSAKHLLCSLMRDKVVPHNQSFESCPSWLQ